MVPNGLVVIDVKTQEILIANREIEEMPSKGREGSLTLKQKLLSFILIREIQDGDARNAERLNSTLRRADSRKGRNLWDHLTSLRELDHGV